MVHPQTHWRSESNYSYHWNTNYIRRRAPSSRPKNFSFRRQDADRTQLYVPGATNRWPMKRNRSRLCSWRTVLCPIHTADADASQLSSYVASASSVWTEFASSRRLPTDSVDNLKNDETDSIAVRLREFWYMLITFSTMTLLCSHLSSTAQAIVNWVTTADGCVHTADTMQLDFAVGEFVQIVETVTN